MATVRSRAQAPVGSAQWIREEQSLADDFISQEVEEFAFSARNEMEWLNEHMADIFNRSQFDVVEAFKTPGKLRGKTPRTARKRNALENRAPLTDIFSANIQKPAPSPAHKSPFFKQISQFHVAEDKDDNHVADAAASSRFSLGTGKENTDSGYHEMSEDEMDVDHTILHSPHHRSPPKPRFVLSIPKQQTVTLVAQDSPVAYREESQDTFVSASEETNAETTAPEYDAGATQDDEDATQPDEDIEDTIAPQKAIVPEDLSTRQSNRFSVSASTKEALDEALELAEPDPLAHPSIEADASSPSSEGSSPQRLLVRKKSSLTFASLPAREPLATKKSVGARTSHAEPSRMNNSSREDNLGRTTFGIAKRDSQQPRANDSISRTTQPEPIEASTDLGKHAETTSEVSEATKEHSKTSTQRLQERLAMLGKSNAPRPSKSIPSSAITSQMHAAHLAQQALNQASSRRASAKEDNEESWIGPMNSQTQQLESAEVDPNEDRATKAAAALKETEVHSENQAAKEVVELKAVYPTLPIAESVAASAKPAETRTSLSYPQLRQEAIHPANPPDVARNDGPISASKAKLFSVLKSAKGIFASSGGASAQAKMEAMSFAQSTDKDLCSANVEATGSTLQNSSAQVVEPDQIKVVVAPAGQPSQCFETSKKDDRRASQRSSARLRSKEENTSENKLGEKTENGVAETDLHHAEPAAVEQSKVDEREQSVPASEGEGHGQQNMPPPPPPKTQFSSSQMHKGELRRPNRPPKDTVQKSRPAPVSIRLASQRIGQMGPTNGATAPSQQEPAPPAVPPKQPSLSKKASNTSLHTSSSVQSFKTTATSTSARPKALEAAARKKEQDEREAQRKAEQKREMERRRAAKVEEERRAAQEQKLAEQRAQEAKQQAQKQALEQRKADALRRAEQQRNQAAAIRNKQPDDFDPAPEHEPRPPPQNHVRSEAPTIRPVSRMGNNQEAARPAVPHINPAKPPKRQFNPDDDYSQKPLPARPGQQDQQPKKRRRTSEDSFVEAVSRPTMAPPVRPSMMRKENMNKFAQGFMSQSNPSHASSSMLKTTINNQHQLQHPKTPHMNDLAKYTNVRIPFADAPNMPQAGTFPTQQHQQQQRLQQPLKTPNSVANVAHKSSPQYPNGDAIDLPEIATDSEDSDDDDFVPPDWANSPALRELLKEQQLVDPLKVFGPIAPLMMEDIFKGNKERLARFRNRTSSANWNGPDRLTEEEIKKDREGRERLEREGGWTFGGST